MKVAITGASGYLGKNIINSLDRRNIEIIRLERKLLYGDIKQLAAQISETDVIINLAGASIIKRWTSKNKAIIYNSRVLTTKNLVKAVNSLPHKCRPKTFISVSAIGIYRENLTHDETSSKYANHFAARVIDDWEDTLVDLPENTRRVIFRTGVVLGKESQFINRLQSVFSLGLGGKIGSGNQPFPFIHIDDLAKAFTEVIFNEKCIGIYNLVAPEQITNKTFTQIFAQKLNRPAVFTVPAFVLQIIYGKASQLILKSPHVIPHRLEMHNFNFQYPTLEACLSEILKE